MGVHAIRMGIGPKARTGASPKVRAMALEITVRLIIDELRDCADRLEIMLGDLPDMDGEGEKS